MRTVIAPARSLFRSLLILAAVVVATALPARMLAQSRPSGGGPAPDLRERVANIEKVLGIEVRAAQVSERSSRIERIERLLEDMRRREPAAVPSSSNSVEDALREARTRLERQDREFESLRRELQSVTTELRDLAGGSRLSPPVERDSVADVRRLTEGVQRDLDSLEMRFSRLEGRSSTTGGSDDARRIAEAAQRDVDRLRDSLYRFESRISRLERP